MYSYFNSGFFIKPMRHRKKLVDKNIPSRPLVCAVLGKRNFQLLRSSGCPVSYLWYKLSCLISFTTSSAGLIYLRVNLVQFMGLTVVSFVVDLMVEFIITHMMKDFPMDLYL